MTNELYGVVNITEEGPNIIEGEYLSNPIVLCKAGDVIFYRDYNANNSQSPLYGRPYLDIERNKSAEIMGLSSDQIDATAVIYDARANGHLNVMQAGFDLAELEGIIHTLNPVKSINLIR